MMKKINELLWKGWIYLALMQSIIIISSIVYYAFNQNIYAFIYSDVVSIISLFTMIIYTIIMHVIKLNISKGG